MDRCTAPTTPRRSRSRWGLFALATLTAIALAIPAAEATHAEYGLRTEGCAVTPGGWGAPPSGHNPGALLHEYFDEIFGDELVVGDLVFEDAQDVTDALPYTGGFDSSFQSHAVALAINIAFGDAGLLDGTVSDIEVEGGAYDGWAAVEILAEAEDVLINDDTITGKEYSDLNTAMDGFNNEAYGCHERPDCPEDLVALPRSDGSVLLEWGGVDGAIEYGIYRSTDGGDLVLIDTTTDTSYLDETTAVGSAYEYGVTAWDGTLESEGCATVTTTAVPFFGAPLLGALALGGSVAAFRIMKRKP